MINNSYDVIYVASLSLFQLLL